MKKIRAGLVATVWMMSASMGMAAVTVPNTFNNGQVADANDINENFTTLESGINSNADDIAELYTYPKIVDIERYTNSTQTSLPLVPSGTLWQVVYDKKSPTSVLHIQGVLVGAGTGGYWAGLYWQFGSAGKQFDDGIYLAAWGSTALPAPYTIIVDAWLTNYTETGSQQLTLGWETANGSASYPFQVLNPAQSQDGRIHTKTTSRLTITEYEE